MNQVTKAERDKIVRRARFLIWFFSKEDVIEALMSDFDISRDRAKRAYAKAMQAI